MSTHLAILISEGESFQKLGAPKQRKHGRPGLLKCQMALERL